MLDRRDIEIVLSEQKTEISRKAKSVLCRRKEESLINLNSTMAQIVIGVRRSGKSTLCFQALHHAGVSFAYVNFDDERLVDTTTEDLNVILEVLYKIYGDFTHLFLDEIQNVQGWHLFVNRLLRQGIKILVTGSNAKLLSSELATHLTGRHTTIELYPFSFREFCNLKQIETDTLTTQAEGLRRAAFDEYLKQGGFPELINEPGNKKYVSELVAGILQRDIKQRYNVRYYAAFEQMANHLMNIAPAILAPAELTELFDFKTAQTTHNYINYLKQAYLLIGISKYSAKSRLRVRDEKIYTVDVSIMDKRPDAHAGENLGWRLETVVYAELMRRRQFEDYDIYYYKKHSRAKEVDFVLCQGNKICRMYQVAYDISNPKTLKREIDSLIIASQATGCKELYLITDHERKIIKNNELTINILPAHEWLLTE